MKKQFLLRGMVAIIPLLFLGFTKPLSSTSYNTSAQGKIFWDELNALTWSHFQVRHTAEDDHAAQSNIGISTSCQYSGKTASITIRATFNRQNSWVRNDCLNGYILEHEQRHFDISELFARQLRKEVSQARFTPKGFSKEYTNIYNSIISRHNDYQDMYDTQTNHSILKEEQMLWNKRIDAELAALAHYAQPTVNLKLAN